MRLMIASKRAALCVVLLLSLSLSVFAQTRTVSGRITDATGAGVPGATITVKGSNTATQTDADGRYSIAVPENGTLVVTSVGYGTQEIRVSNAATFDISLASAASNLNEVVVVGYGSRRARDLTGSVANITTKDFNRGQISTPEQLIQGRTPGVLVTPASGAPGGAATISIRGIGSIRGNQDPLFVIDGVPIAPGGTVGSAIGVEGGTTPNNPLAFINPNDIESMTVLKDASAAAIYGSRGANGVILITTKSGKGGKGQFTFGANTSIAQATRMYDMLEPMDFLRLARQANIQGGAPPTRADTALIGINNLHATDWQDEILRTAISQQYSLGWGIGRKNTSVRLSGSYDNQQGVVKNSSLKRLTARANITQKFLNDRLRFDLATTFANTRNEYPPLSNNAGFQGSLLGAALQFNPTNPIFRPDGLYFQPGDQRNPVQMLDYFKSNDNVNRFLGGLTGSFEIVKGLTYRAVLGYDRTSTERLEFADPRLGAGAYGGTDGLFTPLGTRVRDFNNAIFGNGRTSKAELDVTSRLFEQYLTFDKAFGKHNLNVVGGFSYQDFVSEGPGRIIGFGLRTPVVTATDVFVEDFDNFVNYDTTFPFFDKSELQSYFGRVNYSFNDKYFITGTVRADGSSQFGPDNKYGVFPALAFKWKLMNEGFAQNLLGDWFSDFSVRANYGVLGSRDNLPSYGAVSRQFNYTDASGVAQSETVFTGRTDLRWETATTTGVGVDFATRNNRLSVTLDYYNTVRKDLLFFGPTPGGFAPVSNWFFNLDGDVVNKGLEFSFNYDILKRKNFSWSVNYNMTTLSNEVRGLPSTIVTGGVSGQGLTGAFAQVFTNNQPLFTWSMPVFEGFDKDGNAIYQNGAQNQLVGSALPNFFAGLTNNFTYGRFNLSVFLNTVRGFYVYNNTANALFLKGSLANGRNVTVAAGNSNENPFNPGSVSTRFLEKGDFIRLSNVNLNYNFNLTNSKRIKTLSAFISGQNLAIITDYSGPDPEVNVDKGLNGVASRGFDYTQYPRPRIVTIGINMGF